MRYLPLLLLAACADPAPSNDVVGPFTGEARRFVVDSIQVPRNNTLAREYAGDLNGDKTGDNQLGMVIGTLATQGDVTEHGDEMIEAGAIASTVIITADDFEDDPTVSVLYVGADGDTGIAVGGSLTGGVFEPNRTRETEVPGAASLHLPVFVSADASIIPAIGLEIELTADGAGGFDAEIHGLVPHEQAITAAHAGIGQMLAEEPREHLIMLSMLDGNPRDGVVSRDEFETSTLISALLAPDVTYRGQDVLSLGFRAHLRACAEGTCGPAPRTGCFDRVRDGDESGIDCGGRAACAPRVRPAARRATASRTSVRTACAARRAVRTACAMVSRPMSTAALAAATARSARRACETPTARAVSAGRRARRTRCSATTATRSTPVGKRTKRKRDVKGHGVGPPTTPMRPDTVTIQRGCLRGRPRRRG